MGREAQLRREYARQVCAILQQRLARFQAHQEGVSQEEIEDACLAYLKAKLDYDLCQLENP